MTISSIVLEALAEAVKVTERIALDYCLFGGLAMQSYKRIRSTMDVDLMISIDEEKMKKFITALEIRGFRFDRRMGIKRAGDFEFIRCVYTDKKYQIDVYVDFAAAKSEFHKEILHRKQKLDIFGLKVNVASCEDLILLKALSGRPLDRVDADVLLAENIKIVDKYYLKEWAKKLGVERRLSYMLSHSSPRKA